MTPLSREVLMFRLNNIICILRKNKNSAQVHLVNNLLQTVVSLLDMISSNDIYMEEKELHRILKSVEHKTGELFRKVYGDSSNTAGLPSVK